MEELRFLQQSNKKINSSCCKKIVAECRFAKRWQRHDRHGEERTCLAWLFLSSRKDCTPYFLLMIDILSSPMTTAVGIYSTAKEA
jgi:hypothetical protein